PRLLRLAHHAAQYGSDPGRHHARLRRFHDVVVRSGLEPGDHVHVVVACGQHDDGQVAVGADATADLETVHPGQHQIQHDDVRPQRVEFGQCLLPAFAGLHTVALPSQRQRQPVPYGLVVLDQQHARHGHNYCRPSRFGLITRSMATAREYRVPATRTAPSPSDRRCHPATIVAPIVTATPTAPGNSTSTRYRGRSSSATAKTMPAAAATWPLGKLLCTVEPIRSRSGRTIHVFNRRASPIEPSNTATPAIAMGILRVTSPTKASPATKTATWSGLPTSRRPVTAGSNSDALSSGPGISSSSIR